MTAYIFPGQGSQFSGMGNDLYETNETAKALFEQANEIAGFRISDTMFSGTDEELKQTKVTQPAIFLHSIIRYKTLGDIIPDMVAGHSLGEFTALAANNTLSFEDALKLVILRASAMQKACEIQASAMAAVLALEDAKVEEVCEAISKETGEIVVPANYNCPGQLVISGSVNGIEIACVRMKEAGAKRALRLPVSGAFHSPFMEPAKEELASAIENTRFNTPSCPVYQNVSGLPVTDPAVIKKNLVDQLTGAVRWTQSVQKMIADGAIDFVEAGPGKVLQGLISRIDKSVAVRGEG